MLAVPLLELEANTAITAVHWLAQNKSLLLGLSDGRILRLNAIVSNAYMTGIRSLYGITQGAFGQLSDPGYLQIYHHLYNKIAEVNADKEITLAESVSQAFSASAFDNPYGVFTTPVLWGGEDFVQWGNIAWTATSLSALAINAYVRVGESTDALLSKEWSHFDESVNLLAQYSLDRFNQHGAYIQAKLVLTPTNTISPIVTNFRLSYRTKHSVYFFTSKFSMIKTSDAESVLITGTATEPAYTELKWGIATTNTSDWDDFTIVEMDKLSTIPKTNNIKVGIKMVSNVPYANAIVDEFAIMIGANKDNLLNE